MKIYIALVIFSLNFNLKAFESIASNWTTYYSKVITITCNTQQTNTMNACTQLCGDELQCHIYEDFCHSCLGTELFMTNLFRDIGTKIIPSNEYNKASAIELISSGNFVTFDSKSIFNLLGSYDNSRLRQNFQSLCTDGTERPIIFTKVDYKRRPIKNEFVWCKNGLKNLRNIAENFHDLNFNNSLN
jgi:hypothetical protein